MLTDSNIPHTSLDRCHRVGKKKTIGNIETQPIIARFTSFRDRTKLYRNRKNIKNKTKHTISFDLTKEKLNLLNEAREIVKDNEGILFAYADVNCNLRILTSATKKHISFDSITDLANILANLDGSE